MAITDYIKSVDLKNNTQNILNRSITGKTFVADFKNNYWTVKITTVPMTRTQLHTEFGDFFTTTTDSKKEVNLLPILGTPTAGRGPAQGESDVISMLWPRSVGDTFVGVQGRVLGGDPENDYVSGTLYPGDILTFANHKKIYIVQEAVPVGALSVTNVKFLPPLVKDVGTHVNVNFENVTMQVMVESDITELKTNINGYYTFSQTFREVI